MTSLLADLEADYPDPIRCHACGRPYDPGPAECPYCGYEPRTCEDCGEPISDDAAPSMTVCCTCDRDRREYAAEMRADEMRDRRLLDSLVDDTEPRQSAERDVRPSERPEPITRRTGT